MGGLLAVPAATAAATNSDPAVKPKNIADAARQFEAILIQQMLKSAHAGGGASWAGEDEAGSALADMAEQQFAQMLANGGGMGLAKLVTKGLGDS